MNQQKYDTYTAAINTKLYYAYQFIKNRLQGKGNFVCSMKRIMWTMVSIVMNDYEDMVYCPMVQSLSNKIHYTYSECP